MPKECRFTKCRLNVTALFEEKKHIPEEVDVINFQIKEPLHVLIKFVFSHQNHLNDFIIDMASYSILIFPAVVAVSSTSF